MTALKNHGYYISKIPDTFVDYHAGIKFESTYHYFVRFFSDGFYAKYSRSKYDFEYDQLAISRVAEYKVDPQRYSNAYVTIGKYNVDGYQVFMEAIVDGKVVKETLTIVSPDELLDENLKEYEFEETKDRLTT